MGFGRACAPVRCAHPSFWAHLFAKRGAARPPVHRSFAASHSSKIRTTYFLKQNASLQASGPTSGRQGRIFFHWAKLHPTELHWTLLSYAATSWATLCPILSYPAPCWAMMHPTELCCIQLSYVELRFTLWAKLHPTELLCTLLSYAATSWAMLCSIFDLRCALLSYDAPY